MKLAITQPNFLPWLGYFDLLDQVDTWISLDNVQFVKQSVIVRNKIRLDPERSSWLTVNVEKASPRKRINDMILKEEPWKDEPWWERHLNRVKEQYGKRAAHFDDFFPYFESLIVPQKGDRDLGSYNQRLIQGLCSYMGIALEVEKASDLIPELEGEPEEKVFQLIDKVFPDEYYNFRAGVDAGLYEPKNFKERGIAFYKQDYHHPEYEQDRSPFMSHLSIVDLLMNQPPGRALEIVREGRNWERIA